MRLVKTGFKDCAEVVVLYAREGLYKGTPHPSLETSEKQGLAYMRKDMTMIRDITML